MAKSPSTLTLHCVSVLAKVGTTRSQVLHQLVQATVELQGGFQGCLCFARLPAPRRRRPYPRGGRATCAKCSDQRHALALVAVSSVCAQCCTADQTYDPHLWAPSGVHTTAHRGCAGGLPLFGWLDHSHQSGVSPLRPSGEGGVHLHLRGHRASVARRHLQILGVQVRSPAPPSLSYGRCAFRSVLTIPTHAVRPLGSAGLRWALRLCGCRKRRARARWPRRLIPTRQRLTHRRILRTRAGRCARSHLARRSSCRRLRSRAAGRREPGVACIAPPVRIAQQNPLHFSSLLLCCSPCCQRSMSSPVSATACVRASAFDRVGFAAPVCGAVQSVRGSTQQRVCITIAPASFLHEEPSEGVNKTSHRDLTAQCPMPVTVRALRASDYDKGAWRGVARAPWAGSTSSGGGAGLGGRASLSVSHYLSSPVERRAQAFLSCWGS
jgi:hypothetical protein